MYIFCLICHIVLGCFSCCSQNVAVATATESPESAVSHQLLVVFDALNDIGILYTHLKSDDTILVKHKAQPYWVKLIDFGLALPVSQLVVGLKNAGFWIKGSRGDFEPPVVWSYWCVGSWMCRGLSVLWPAPLPCKLWISLVENYGAAAGLARGSHAGCLNTHLAVFQHEGWP